MTSMPSPQHRAAATADVSAEQLSRAEQDALLLAALCAPLGGADPAWLATSQLDLARLESLGLVSTSDNLLVSTPSGVEIAAAVPSAERHALARAVLEGTSTSIIDPIRAGRLRASLLAACGEREEARSQWTRAGRASAAAGEPIGAAADLLQAAELATEPIERARLLHERARILHVVGGDDGIAAWQDLDSALEEVDASQLRELRAEARFRRYWLDPEAQETTLDVAAGMRDGSNGWAAHADAVRLSALGENEAAEQADVEALGLARSNDDRVLEALALTGLAYLRSYLGRVDEAIEAQRAAIAIDPSGRGSRTHVEGALNLADMLLEQLDLPAAIAELARLDALLDPDTTPGLAIAARIQHAWALAQHGRLREAVALVHTTGDAERAQAPWLRSLSLVLAAQVLADAGDGERAFTLLDRADELLERANVESIRFQSALVRAHVLAATGAAAEAIALGRTLDIAEPLSMGELALLLATEGVRADDAAVIGDALRIVDAALAAAPGSPLLQLAARHVALLSAAAAGDVAAGEELEDVATAWADAGFELASLRLLHAAGTLLVRAGATRRGVRMQLAAQRGFLAADAAADHLLAHVDGPVNQPARDAGWAFLADASDASRARIGDAIAQARTVRFQRGELVLRAEDTASTRVFLLRSGQVRLYRERPDAKQLLVGVVTPGGLFGPGISPGSYPMLNAIATEDCELHVLEGAQLLELVQGEPAVMHALLAHVAGELARSQQLTELVAFASIEARLAATLLELDARFGHPTLAGGRIINEKFTQGELAAMIGASREQVARAISRWRSAGIIRLDGKRIGILEIDTVRALAASE